MTTTTQDLLAAVGDAGVSVGGTQVPASVVYAAVVVLVVLAVLSIVKKLLTLALLASLAAVGFVLWQQGTFDRFTG